MARISKQTAWSAKANTLIQPGNPTWISTRGPQALELAQKLSELLNQRAEPLFPNTFPFFVHFNREGEASEVANAISYCAQRNPGIMLFHGQLVSGMPVEIISFGMLEQIVCALSDVETVVGYRLLLLLKSIFDNIEVPESHLGPDSLVAVT